MLAPHLLGRNPDPREEIWQDLRREMRAYDHMGHGPIDIALWDLAGRRRNVSVSRAARRLSARGCRPMPAPIMARTNPAASIRRKPSPITRPPAASRGFAGLQDPRLARRRVRARVANVLGVRSAVGDDWPLMLDPASQLRTWADAL